MFEEVKKLDSNFNENKFKGYADNVFIQIHTAITKRNILAIRHFVSDTVYNQLNEKITYLKNNKLIQFYDELNVASTNIIKVKIIEDEIFIMVEISFKYIDYTIDENNKIVKGYQEFRPYDKYILTFRRLLNVNEIKYTNCCNGCGNNLDINNSGVCEYCGTIYNLNSHNFILYSMELKSL